MSRWRFPAFGTASVVPSVGAVMRQPLNTQLGNIGGGQLFVQAFPDMAGNLSTTWSVPDYQAFEFVQFNFVHVSDATVGTRRLTLTFVYQARVFGTIRPAFGVAASAAVTNWLTTRYVADNIIGAGLEYTPVGRWFLPPGTSMSVLGGGIAGDVISGMLLTGLLWPV